MTAISPNLWSSADHALQYLARADGIPHRTEGERALLEWLPVRVDRFLDLGSGDGRLAALVKTVHPAAQVVALDFSALMLERLRERFADDRSITILNHSLDHPLPVLGKFDTVVSSFAIHHVSHERKRALYAELRNLRAPGTQLIWLRELGFEDVDCTWKWMDGASLARGTNPQTPNPNRNPEPNPNPNTNREQ